MSGTGIESGVWMNRHSSRKPGDGTGVYYGHRSSRRQPLLPSSRFGLKGIDENTAIGGFFTVGFGFIIFAVLFVMMLIVARGCGSEEPIPAYETPRKDVAWPASGHKKLK